MKLDIYDTYVRTTDGVLMHFDVLVPQGNGTSAVAYAQQWLQNMGISYNQLTHENCCYCHSEIATPEMEQHINQHGYFILEMECCPETVR